ncbi:MAG: pilin, partial [Rectinemataceae bacterium]|nr:pilin [Rectinemataceae bacterium]
MKRLWAPLLLLVVLFVPFVVSAQSNLPLFDPDWQLVPDAHKIDPENCPEGYPLGFGGVLQLVQNGMNAAISFGVIIFVLVIAGAGILWILTPTNPENHSQAKKILTNGVIGLLIILSAWLMVDFVMKILYNPNAYNLGPWNEILVGGDLCIKPAETKALFTGNLFTAPGATSGSYDPRYTTSGACSPQSVQQAGQSVNITAKEAKFLACIARPESTCGTKLANYNWGKGSSAYGPFMILLDGNARYLENEACRTAANVSGRLNCQNGFTNGNPIPGSAIANYCMRAAANLACSTTAATTLLLESGARPWTGNHDSKPAHNRCAQ